MGKKRVAKRKSEDDSESDGYEAGNGSDNDAESEGEEGSGEEEGGTDGFANVMAKLLGQRVTKSVPVLAKRKTQQIRAIEQDHKERRELHEKRMNRLAEREKQHVVPSLLTQDHERKLRRIATRGVVALFNAIATAKKEAVAMNAAVAETGSGASAALAQQPSGQEIKRMTQANFLDMLKGGSAAGRSDGQAPAGRTVEDVRGVDASTLDEGGHLRSDQESSGTDKGPGWSALRDTIMPKSGASALKNWDKGLLGEGVDDSDADDMPDPFAAPEEQKKKWVSGKGTRKATRVK